MNENNFNENNNQIPQQQYQQPRMMSQPGISENNMQQHQQPSMTIPLVAKTGGTKIIAIIIALIVIGGSAWFLLSGDNKDGNNDNGKQNNEKNITNQNNSAEIQKIKENKFAEIFGENGTEVYPPQSFIVNNIVSINPNNNERVLVTSAAFVGNDPTFYYILDENRIVKVSIKSSRADGFIVQKSLNGVDILVSKNYSDSSLENLPRHILLKDIPHHSAGYNWYIYMEPGSAISSEEVLTIAENIVIDKSRGEFMSDGEEAAIITNNSYLSKKYGNIEFNLENILITKWTTLGAGNNEIIYFIKLDSGYMKMELKLPHIYGADTSSIEAMRKQIEESNKDETSSKLWTEELVEFEFKEHTFYARKTKIIKDDREYFSSIYVELDGNRMASFSSGEIKDLDSVKKVIENGILNKVLFFN